MADIEILIRMSEQLWNNLNNPNRFNAISDIWEMEKSVTNGKVLPKGHGRLIDADDIDNHIIGHVDTRSCPTIIEADKEQNT